jgi:hypothetical protein
MATLEKRLAALEAAAAIDPDQGTGFDFAPVMAYDEWCEAAAKQQAELIKDTYEQKD